MCSVFGDRNSDARFLPPGIQQISAMRRRFHPRIHCLLRRIVITRIQRDVFSNPQPIFYARRPSTRWPSKSIWLKKFFVAILFEWRRAAFAAFSLHSSAGNKFSVRFLFASSKANFSSSAVFSADCAFLDFERFSSVLSRNCAWVFIKKSQNVKNRT